VLNVFGYTSLLLSKLRQNEVRSYIVTFQEGYDVRRGIYYQCQLPLTLSLSSELASMSIQLLACILEIPAPCSRIIWSMSLYGLSVSPF